MSARQTKASSSRTVPADWLDEGGEILVRDPDPLWADSATACVGRNPTTGRVTLEGDLVTPPGRDHRPTAAAASAGLGRDQLRSGAAFAPGMGQVWGMPRRQVLRVLK